MYYNNNNMSSNPREKSKRREAMDRRVSESGEELCPVCSDVIKIYAVGDCDHPICFKCLTRMRVLCEQMYCAICRSDLPKVAFIRSGEAKFEDLNLSKFRLHHTHKIFFEDESAKMAFFELQEHKCVKCHDLKAFRTFPVLRDHMRKEHNVHCCELCVKHIKIFSKERKFYERKALAEHRRVGDPDDRSHKGHPLCKFCDERYLDNDELLKHLRKQHYYCHFCEADGISNEYYDIYPSLRDHFRDGHYLCEEDECYHVEFTNVFRDEIDFKAHKAAMHSKNLKKAMAKAARTLELEFSIAPRQAARRDNTGKYCRDDYSDVQHDEKGRAAYGQGRSAGMSRRDRERQREEDDMQRAMTASLNQATFSSVSVVDSALLQPASLSNSSDDVRFGKNQTHSGNKGDIKAIGDKRKHRRSPDEQRRMFEDVSRNEYATGNVKVKSMKDSCELDSDSDDYRAFVTKAEPKELTPPPQPEAEPAPCSSMANKIKLANNFSVQSGPLDDFPSIGGAKQSILNYPKTNKSGGSPVEDFPTLGGKPTKTNKSGGSPVEDFPTLGGKPTKTSKSGGSLVEDFPTLGGKPKSALSSKVSMGSSWNKGAPTASAKSITTKANVIATNTRPLATKTKTNTRPLVTSAKPATTANRAGNSSSRASNSASSNGNKRQVTVMDESSSDFPSLSMIGDALLKGAKITGSASDAATKYASSASAARPVSSNVRVVTEKPEIESHVMASTKPSFSNQDFPGMSGSSNSSSDFPLLKGAKKSNDRPVATTNTSWGRKPKLVEEPVAKIEQPASGMLKMKTKLKRKTNQEAIPVRENSPDLCKSAQISMIAFETPSDEKTSSKTKSKKSTKSIPSVESSSDSLKSVKNVSETKDENKVKKELPKDDPVDAFLKHWKEEEMKHSDVAKDALSNGHSDSKKDKSKKKKKKAKSSPESTDQFFPGPIQSSENKETSRAFAARKENVSDATPPGTRTNISDPSIVEWKVDDASVASVATQEMPTSQSFHQVSSGDFPVLGRDNGEPHISLEPPPGFKSSGTSKPPPGFGQTSSAPPGFQQRLSLGPSAIANGTANDVAPLSTNGNAHHENRKITFKYIKPQDFDNRNVKLIKDIRALVNDGQFTEFKHYSTEFRNGVMDAASYYKQCSLLLGRKHFDAIYPELLVLLPVIGKQQELLKAHDEYLQNDPIVKLSGKSYGAKSWKTDDQFNTCTFCQQVLLTRDSNDHMMTHGDNDNFPNLASSQAKGLFGMGSWGIKT